MTEDGTFACALGAAEHALSGADVCSGRRDASPGLQEVIKVTVDEEDVPEEVALQRTFPIGFLIVRLNDKHNWSREAIAEYVGWLIDERGYDLTVEATQSCENEEQLVAA